jgi:hypothetical protein
VASSNIIPLRSYIILFHADLMYSVLQPVAEVGGGVSFHHKVPLQQAFLCGENIRAIIQKLVKNRTISVAPPRPFQYMPVIGSCHKNY